MLVQRIEFTGDTGLHCQQLKGNFSHIIILEKTTEKIKADQCHVKGEIQESQSYQKVTNIKSTVHETKLKAHIYLPPLRIQISRNIQAKNLHKKSRQTLKWKKVYKIKEHIITSIILGHC